MKSSAIKNVVLFGLIVVGVFAIGLWYGLNPSVAYLHAADTCIEEEDVDCMLKMLGDVYSEEGGVAAFDYIDYFFEHSAAFASTDCHVHAHIVGDYAYYHDYLKHGDLTQMEFPQELRGCGNGFLHGFMEHLIQNNPDPAFVEEACRYLEDQLRDDLPGILRICFHGAGHGLMLARADTMSTEEWGNEYALAVPVLEKCEALKEEFDDAVVSKCREGAFNVLMNWMSFEEFGLTFNSEDPFRLCREFSGERQGNCYFILGQRIDYFSDFNLSEAVEIVDRQVPDEFSYMLIKSVAAALVRQVPHKGASAFTDVVKKCLGLNRENLRHGCIDGVVAGGIHHGPPEVQFSKVQEMCAWDQLSVSEREVCDDALFRNLTYYFSASEQARLCSESRTSFQQLCQQGDVN